MYISLKDISSSSSSSIRRRRQHADRPDDIESTVTSIRAATRRAYTQLLHVQIPEPSKFQSIHSCPDIDIIIFYPFLLLTSPWPLLLPFDVPVDVYAQRGGAVPLSIRRGPGGAAMPAAGCARLEGEVCGVVAAAPVAVAEHVERGGTTSPWNME